VERFNEAPIIFLTVCTRNRKRILANSEVVVLLRDSWHEANSWMVGRFIVMPDHLHLFCAPVENLPRPLSHWVRYWKTVASRRWPRPQEQPV
jgi:putative transposase